MDHFGDSTTSVEWYKSGLIAGNGQDDRMRFQKSTNFSTASPLSASNLGSAATRGGKRLVPQPWP